jgi:uncharacterized protein with HEPN domain
VSGSDLGRVRDILGCVEAIARAEATAQRYPKDSDVGWVALEAVQHRVVAIGEAVTSLSLDIREDHPAVAWSELERMPDQIGQHDDQLDLQTVLAIIGQPLKNLQAACRAILAESVRIGEDEP